MVGKKKADADAYLKKLELLNRLKSALLSFLGYSAIIIALILAFLIGGGLARPDMAFPDLGTIAKIVGIFYAFLVGILGILASLITILNYLGNRPRISVSINYGDSWRDVQTRDDAYNPRGTSVRLSLNIYADSNKTVSIRKILLEETVGSTKNTLNSEGWRALNIPSRHSEDLRLNFYSENTVSKPKPSYELIIIYAKDKEERIQLDL